MKGHLEAEPRVSGTGTGQRWAGPKRNTGEAPFLRAQPSLPPVPTTGWCLTCRAVCMAAFDTLHGARQRLGVLARDGTGRGTAVITPLALIPILVEVPLLAILGCGNRTRPVCATREARPAPKSPKETVARPMEAMTLGEAMVMVGN